MRQDERWIAAVALQIERYPEQGSNDFSVEALVVNNLGRRKRGRTQAGNRGKSQLLGVAALEIVDPKVAGLVGSLMGNDHAVALWRKLAGIAREYVQAMRQVHLLRFVGRAIDEIGVDHSVLIDGVGESCAVGRKTAGVGLPFQVCNPCDFSSADVEQGDVHVTALG